MARSSPSSKYQRGQSITFTSWSVCAMVGALSAWAYLNYRDATQSASLDGDAATQSSPSASSMRQWLDGTEPQIDNLVAARGNIASAAARHDIPGTAAACQVANGAVVNLHRQMPSPGRVLDSFLQQAITSYAAGFSYCTTASRPGDGDGLQRAAAYLSQGDVAMQAALGLLSKDPGARPSNGVLIV